MPRQLFVDTHLHLQVRLSDRPAAVEQLRRLRRRGAELLVFYRDEIAPGARAAYQRLLAVPRVEEAERYAIGEAEAFELQRQHWEFIRDATDDAGWLGWFPQITFPTQATDENLRRWRAEGCRGVKLVEISEELPGPERAAVGAEAAGDAHARVFRFCAEHGLPLTLHADLRVHRRWVERLLTRHPELRLSFAHFGYGRAIVAELLDRFPGTFTDFANLARRAQADPGGYGEFMRRFATRVVLGSDAFLGDLSAVDLHVDVVEDLFPRQAQQILYENPQRFLGEPGAHRPAPQELKGTRV